MVHLRSSLLHQWSVQDAVTIAYAKRKCALKFEFDERIVRVRIERSD